MESKSRSHDFENKLTLIRKGSTYLHCYWEKGLYVKIKRTPKLDEAYDKDDFELIAEMALNSI